MPIPISNPRSLTLNALAAQHVHFNTYVRQDGQLTASAVIALAVGSTDEAGKWDPQTGLVPVRGARVVNIPDVLNLPADLVSIAPEVQAIFGGIISALAKINAVRQLV